MPNGLRRRRQPPSMLPPPTSPASTPPHPGSRSRPPVVVYVVRRSSPAEIITIAVLIAVLLLLGVGLMMWAVRTDLAFGPTPTPTATPGPPRSPTTDFRATRVAEDMLTQTAHQALLMGTRTPTPVDLVTSEAPGVLLTRELTATATLTPTEVTVMLPGVVVGPITSTETPTPETPTEEPTPTAIIVLLPIGMAHSPLPTPTPTDTPPFIPPTEIPTDTPPPVVPPTDTPTFTVEPPTPTPPPPTATPTTTPVYLVSSLRAVVQNQNTTMRLGPSNIYTPTGTIGANAEVQLLGRSRSGEWVYACCLADNRPAWIRQAYARPSGNTLGSDAPEDANPNDVRWLPVQPIASDLQPLPEVTPVPGEDYPLYRYTRDARGQLPQVPPPPLDLAWPVPGQASQPLISPVAVSGASVLVASADHHLYSFDRINGNQRWRNNLGQPIRQAPAVVDGTIFVADETGRLIALQDRGNESVQIWNTSTGRPAVTSFNVYSDTLFIGLGADDVYEVVAVDRRDGSIRNRHTMIGSVMRYPVIGDQLVYAAGGQVVARDVFNYEVVWERGDLNNISAGPVYSSPGVRGLAELYLVDGNNRIWCLDANTGVELWNFDNGEPATGLAVNDRMLFVSGNGYVKAIRRDSVEQAWRAASGPVVGGVWADNVRVLALTQGGSLQFMDAATGNILGSATVPATAGGAGAVSGPWVFIPGSDGNLYALRAVQ